MPSFPRTLPDWIESCEMKLVYSQEGDGPRSPVQDYGDPYWVAKVRTGKLNDARLREWRAIVSSLEGMKNEILVFDPKVPYPQDYPSGFSGMNRRVTDTSFSGGTIDIRAVTATTLGGVNVPLGLQFRAGDMIGIRRSGYYWLGLVQDDAQALTGGTIGANTIMFTVSVKPNIPTAYFPADGTGVIADLIRPKVKMRLDQGSWGNPTSVRPEAATLAFTQWSY